MLPSIEQRLAAEIAAKPAQIAAAIALLDEGATVPFISRYRKEATGIKGAVFELFLQTELLGQNFLERFQPRFIFRLFCVYS